MKPYESFLEYLRVHTGSEYLSELRYNKFNREKLMTVLAEEEAWGFPEKEWLDACSYIANEKAVTKEEARQKLLGFLHS